MVKGILVGLLLGFPLGALVVHAVDGVGPSDQVAVLPGVPEIAEREHGAALRRPGGDPTATLIGRPVGDVEEPQAATSSVVETQKEVMAQALRAGDWPAYHRALVALGAADTLEADRVLVSVLENEDLVFPKGMAKEFTAWLEGSQASGIAKAAWRRIAVEVSTLGASRELCLRGWAGLLGAEGSREDLERVRHEGDVAAYGRAVGAFLATGRPEALAMAQRIVASRHRPEGLDPGEDALAAIRAVMADDFDAGADVVEEEVRHGRERGGSVVALPELVVLYAEHLPPERLAEGTRWLLDLLNDVEDGSIGYPIDALLRAVATLRRRGLEPSGLEPIQTWGVRTVLNIVEAGGPSSNSDPRWQAALRSVEMEHDGVVALEARIAALEAALPYAYSPEPSERLLRRLRARRQWTGSEHR